MGIIRVASGGDDDNHLQLLPLITSEDDDRGREAAPTDRVTTHFADPEMEMAESNDVPWSDLPFDMLVKILDHSGGSLVDCLALRSVCSQWRRFIPPPRTILSSFLPVKVPSFNDSDHRQLSQSLADGVVAASSICLARAPIEASSSSESVAIFFLFVGEFVGKKIWLQNPLSKSLVSEMPCYLLQFLNLLDFDIVEVGKYCSLSSVPFNYKSLPPFKLDKEIIKVVMFSNGRAIVALTATGKLLMLKFGQESWHVLDTFMDLKFDDMVDFEGKVFAVGRTGLVCAIECDGTANVLEVSIPGFGIRRKRLVRSSNELYVIVASSSFLEAIPRSFRVHKLRLDEPSWDQVPSLGDAMFFVGYDSSFSVSTRGSIGHLCKRGTILYTDESFPFHSKMDQDPRPKGEKDVLELRFFHLEHTGRDEATSSAAYTSMFWPPPIWLLSNAM